MAPKRRAAPPAAQVRLDAFAVSPAAQAPIDAGAVSAPPPAPPPEPPPAQPPAQPPAPQPDADAAWRAILEAVKSFGLDTRWGVVALVPCSEGVLVHGQRLAAVARALRRPVEGLLSAWRSVCGGADLALLRPELLRQLPEIEATRVTAEEQRRLCAARLGPVPRLPPWRQSVAADGGLDVPALRGWLGLSKEARHVAFGLRDVPQPLRTAEEMRRDGALASERGVCVEDLEREVEEYVPRPCPGD
jgi:hypothetical protein